jgi:hypothetical protein
MRRPLNSAVQATARLRFCSMRDLAGAPYLSRIVERQSASYETCQTH